MRTAPQGQSVAGGAVHWFLQPPDAEGHSGLCMLLPGSPDKTGTGTRPEPKTVKAEVERMPVPVLSEPLTRRAERHYSRPNVIIVMSSF